MKTEQRQAGVVQPTTSSASRIATRLYRPGTPVVSTIAAIVGFWLSEAVLHYVMFDEHSFLTGLLFPGAHELWMRAVVTVVLTGVGIAWRMAAVERQARITSLERYQGRLQELSLELACANSEERRDLARRLHDDIGQQLAAGRLFLASLDDRVRADNPELVSVSRIFDRTTTQIREIAEELAPRSLDEFGMSEAMESLARRVMRRSGVSVEVSVRAICAALPQETRQVAFEVTADVLEMAARDASVRHIDIRCHSLHDRLRVELDWNAPTSSDFFFAAERISHIGGTLRLTPEADRTSLSLSVPIPA